jgi:PAS domain S-box-containing protein
LGQFNGIDLLTEAIARGVSAPIILLTGQGDYRVDVEAMKAGAADYLSKENINAGLLERSIRYAIERTAAHLELERYRAHLEDLVKERTKEVEWTNAQLREEMAERQKAVEALRESEEQYRILVQSALDIIYTLDTEGVITSVNPAFEAVTGWAPSEWIGKHYGALIHPEDLATVGARLRTFLMGNNAPPVELRLQSRKGEYVVCEFRTRPQIRGRVVVGILGIARDVTARRRAEEMVRERNEFLNHVLESLTHPFIVLDARDHTVKMANSAATVAGLSVDTPCYQVVHNRNTPCEGNEHACPLREIQATKKPVTVEHIHYDSQGNPKNVEIHAYPIFGQDGEVEQVIEYSFDVTDRKLMEEELRSTAEKVKLFAYSVSHDLKSPIVGIGGLTKLLCRQYATRLDEKGLKYCEQILKASDQVISLVEDINAYIKSKEAPLRFETVHPEEIMQAIGDEFAIALETQGVKWLPPERLPEMRFDRVSILRVFRNLVDNALKYGGDEMTEIEVTYKDSKDFHFFSVRDNGKGMGLDSCEKIFNLFERDESSRGVEGTGLGLSIVKEVIKRHRGDVSVTSCKGVGTTFTFSISKRL